MPEGGRGQRGQGTVEWVGLLAVVALLFTGLVAAGARVPGAGLARAVASRLLCAVALAERCGDEPALIAAYGDEVGRVVRRRMPTILLESGSRSLPVDFRRCRESACADGTPRGRVLRTDAGLPVTAFVHVVDCREGAPAGGTARMGIEDLAGIEDSAGSDPAAAIRPANPDCSGPRAGRLYLQYWLYYPESSTLRGVPVAGRAGHHADDWESVQVRVGPDGGASTRASSHHGYNYSAGAANWGSDAGIGVLRDAAEALGARPRNGWGPATGALLVSAGSHAGNAAGYPDVDRLVPGRHVHLVPLEPLVAADGDGYRFAISAPWRKDVWSDPEAATTG